ncbi:MAG: MBL fold metallo-hydrolase [Parvibaculum sp.]|nr:MBL fold metallo-hydrolase [Parvibaculum sp.]|tara:strand:- start:2929 stop:3579 length:651 start_codon:yes stop_codon:yes gene_type:complete
MSLKAAILPVTPFRQNCTLLWNEATMRGAVSDPGGDLDQIMQTVEELGITLEKVLLTHGHLDHASAAGELAERLDIPIEGPHRDDLFLISDLPKQGAKYGFPVYRSFEPTRWLEHGDTVEVGGLTFQVLHCPGHTPGHIVFFNDEARLAIVGDVLFNGSIGRTDLPRGDYASLVDAIRGKLWPLGDDVTFVPGHGPLSTFGAERRSNPFVADENFG